MRRVTTVALIALLICLVPYRRVLAPDWTVAVIDEKGNPVPGVTVREVFQDYSYEFVGGGSADAVTNTEGKVHFPLLRKWEIVGGLLVHGILSVPGFVHNSYGVHSFVFAFGDGIRGDWDEHGVVGDWTGEPRTMRSTVVVKPDSSSK